MNRSGVGIVFVAPALLLIAVFFAVPVLGALLLSFTDFDIYALGNPQVMRWIGLTNYQHLLADPLFWVALGNTTYFVLVGGTLSLLLSLAAALAVNHPLARWRSGFRTAYFVPVVTTLVAVAVVWRSLYHPQHGYLNHALRWLGLAPVDWLGDPAWSMPAIILLAVWKNFGFNFVVLVAALQAIPVTLYEAAAIDGASGLQILRHITLPALRPTLGFLALMTAIGYCQLFAEPYVMTQGGPGHATLSIVLLMYQEGFRWWNIGYASAIAFTLCAIVAALSLLPRYVARLRS